MSDSLYLGALGALATVIGVLWRVNCRSADNIEKRADKIEGKYDESAARQLKMAEELGELRGEVHFAKTLTPKIEALHEDFLRVYPRNDD